MIELVQWLTKEISWSTSTLQNYFVCQDSPRDSLPSHHICIILSNQILETMVMKWGYIQGNKLILNGQTIKLSFALRSSCQAAEWPNKFFVSSVMSCSCQVWWCHVTSGRKKIHTYNTMSTFVNNLEVLAFNVCSSLTSQTKLLLRKRKLVNCVNKRCPLDCN